MIFLTGDTHGSIDIKKLNSKNFDSSDLTKNDFVIVLGDFGFIWDGSREDKWWLNWLQQRKFTTLFVDGNHENHDMLDEMPVTEWNGGKIHRINDSVFHLMRGQIFTIDDRKFFVFGGADSIDKEGRRVGISWWPREMPSYAEYEEGLTNLEKHDNTVDYILTHTCPSDISKSICNYKDITSVEKYFDVIQDNIKFRHWYFGHYHTTNRINDKFTCIYNEVIRLT